MAEQHRTRQKKQGEIDPKFYIRQRESESLFAQNPAEEQDTFSVGETPFLPRMGTHAELLAQTSSDKIVHHLVMQLHKTYGNSYVQHLLNSKILQTKLATSNQNDVVGTKAKITHRATQIARTPSATPPKGTITIGRVTNTHYDVTGDTLEEVSGQLDPEEWGRCLWTWSQSYRTTEGVADRINVTLGLSIRMPRWAGRGWRRASGEARTEWNRMLECLRAHENHHAEIARSWPSKLQDKLHNQSEGELDRLWNEGLADHQNEQDTYDSDTSHGETEGVTLDTNIE